MSQMHETTDMPPSDAAIVGRLIDPEKGDISPEAAKAILKIRFGDRDRERMHELAVKNQEGRLTAEEQAEMEGYRRVGFFLATLWAKARASLKASGMDANGHGS